jgi:phosphate starvation-inducible protein PhoH
MGKLTRKHQPTTPLPEDHVVKTKKQLICSIVKKKTKQKFLSENQKTYYETLVSNQITIFSGPAGVGKSYIEMK